MSLLTEFDVTLEEFVTHVPILSKILHREEMILAFPLLRLLRRLRRDIPFNSKLHTASNPRLVLAPSTGLSFASILTSIFSPHGGTGESRVVATRLPDFDSKATPDLLPQQSLLINWQVAVINLEDVDREASDVQPAAGAASGRRRGPSFRRLFAALFLVGSGSITCASRRSTSASRFALHVVADLPP